MSFSANGRINRGAYGSPFSGVGLEFMPFGIMPDHSGLVLYESGYQSRNTRWIFPNVLSPFWRLYYNFTPGHKIVFQGQDYPLGPDRLMLIPDDQLFHCHGTIPVRNLWLAFNPSRRLDSTQRIPIQRKPTPVELELTRMLEGLFRSGEERNRERIYNVSLALLHLVMADQSLRWQPDRVPAGIERVVRHVEQSYAQEMTIPTLAGLAGMSLSTFSRGFRQSRGVSAARFIMQVRVREAARLLIQGQQTIDEVAEHTGFPNRAYFSRVFKALTGESPAHFRHRHTPW